MPESQVRCRQCDNEVPEFVHCVICGNVLADAGRPTAPGAGRFSAAPNESARAIRLLSTLFPQLPRADLGGYRLAVTLGTAAILLLVVAGLYPVAMVAGAVLVPLLVVVYAYAVDIYEDDPLPVLGATVLWGVAAGAGMALLVRALGPDQALTAAGFDATQVLRDGIVLPLVQLVAVLAGPLLLLPYRRFNDVLDGTTFGVAAAAAFSAAYTLTTAVDLLGSGLQPGGDPFAWVVTIITVALVRPVLLAGAVGFACAAFWLRYRAPAANPTALGWAGAPWAAVGVAGLLVVANAGAGMALGPMPAVVIRIGLAVVAVVLLRRAIHLGLLQESREIPIGPAIRCANCGNQTPHHSFCGNCGISLRALPKPTTHPSRPPSVPPEPVG